MQQIIAVPRREPAVALVTYRRHDTHLSPTSSRDRRARPARRGLHARCWRVAGPGVNTAAIDGARVGAGLRARSCFSGGPERVSGQSLLTIAADRGN